MKIKNIANRPIPVDGTKLKPESGEVVEVKEITPGLRRMIKNGFFEVVDESEPENKEVEKVLEEEEDKEVEYPAFEIEPEVDQKEEEPEPVKEMEYPKPKKNRRSRKSFSEEI